MALVDLMNQLDEEKENARNHARACSEVIAILEHFSQKDQKRIPSDFMHYLKKHKDPDHIIHVHRGLPLNEQDISRDAKALLVLIHIHFFCKTDTDRECVLTQLYRNEGISDTELPDKVKEGLEESRSFRAMFQSIADEKPS